MPKRRVTPEEQELIEKAHRYLPAGSLGNVATDILIREGRGGRVWDASGNEFVDYLLGSGPMLVGHAHPEVVAAVEAQNRRGSTFFATNEHAVRLAEEIVAAVPCAEKVRFSSSGTEATLYAMRTVRAYRKRDKVLKFEGGFHGMNDYALMSVFPAEPPEYPHPSADSAGIPQSIKGEMLIAPFNDIETTTAIIERHHDDLAGVIVEPFQRVIPPAAGFLEGLREVTKLYEIPLIFDEIVTGFRFAYGGAQEYYGVTPDLCTLGKTVAGGFPLTAVAGSSELMDQFDRSSADGDSFMPQIGTLSGNPIAAAAGLATLEVLRREGAYERLFATGQKLRLALERILNEAEIPARVVGIDPLFDVLFTDSDVTDYRSTLLADKQKLGRFTSLLLEHGVFRGETKFYVSTAHTQDDVDRTIEAFSACVEELQDS